MLKKIKRYIRKQLRITQILENQEQIKKQLDLLLMQNEELLKSSVFNNSIIDSKWLKHKSFSPGGWAVDYTFLYTLYRVLTGMRPKSILEFGLGQSSKLIHQYAHFYEDVDAVTYEHDPKWIEFFKCNTDSDYNFSIKLIELENITYKGVETLSYKDIDKEYQDRQYDLVVVDAPFGSNRYSRPQILELAKTNLADSFCIIIDDYNREGEKETGRELMNILDEKNINYLSVVYGGSKQHFLMCSENLGFLTTL